MATTSSDKGPGTGSRQTNLDDFQRRGKEALTQILAQLPLWLEGKNKKIVTGQSMIKLPKVVPRLSFVLKVNG